MDNIRVNLPKDTYKFKGPGGHLVYLEAFEIWLRGVTGRGDLLRSDPTVMLVPVGREEKYYYDFSFDIPIEHLDTVIEGLVEVRNEAEDTDATVRYMLKQRHLPRKPCGLNADWSSSAWHLSEGEPNTNSGDYYLLDTESYEDRPMYEVVSRDYGLESQQAGDDIRVVVPVGHLADVLDRFKELIDTTVGCDQCGRAVPALEVWSRDEEVLCKGCHDQPTG